MPIVQHDIDKLIAIYEKQFGENISNEEAWEMGINLLNLFRLLLGHTDGPITRKKK
jgi:hypothetical protein